MCIWDSVCARVPRVGVELCRRLDCHHASRKSQEHIIKEDQTLLLNKVLNYQFLHHIINCCKCRLEEAMGSCTWPPDSSVLLKYQTHRNASAMKNLVRVITYPDHATSKCPLCDISIGTGSDNSGQHFTDEHTKSDSPYGHGPLWLTLWPPWTPHV